MGAAHPPYHSSGFPAGPFQRCSCCTKHPGQGAQKADQHACREREECQGLYTGAAPCLLHAMSHAKSARRLPVHMAVLGTAYITCPHLASLHLAALQSISSCWCPSPLSHSAGCNQTWMTLSYQCMCYTGRGKHRSFAKQAFGLATALLTSYTVNASDRSSTMPLYHYSLQPNPHFATFRSQRQVGLLKYWSQSSLLHAHVPLVASGLKRQWLAQHQKVVHRQRTELATCPADFSSLGSHSGRREPSSTSCASLDSGTAAAGSSLQRSKLLCLTCSLLQPRCVPGLCSLTLRCASSIGSFHPSGC